MVDGDRVGDLGGEAAQVFVTGRAAWTVEYSCSAVVLMDVRMPEIDGVEAARRLCVGGCPSRILMLTTFDLDEYVYASLRAGASVKDTLAADLLSAIRVVVRGDAVVAPSVTRRLLERYVGTGPDPTAPTRRLRLRVGPGARRVRPGPVVIDRGLQPEGLTYASVTARDGRVMPRAACASVVGE
ncbi:response regulator transcription factor [Actinophytocola sp.]|uniref:response regulator n=1 Tax=Actinophytocola sp. TaxID=1872138 RepID=UPI002ED6B696